MKKIEPYINDISDPLIAENKINKLVEAVNELQEKQAEILRWGFDITDKIYKIEECRHDWIEQYDHSYCKKCNLSKPKDQPEECKHTKVSLSTTEGVVCGKCGRYVAKDQPHQHSWVEIKDFSQLRTDLWTITNTEYVKRYAWYECNDCNAFMGEPISGKLEE